jgi:hypothetical protein
MLYSHFISHSQNILFVLGTERDCEGSASSSVSMLKAVNMSIIQHIVSLGVIYSIAVFYGITTLARIFLKLFVNGTAVLARKERSSPPKCLKNEEYGTHNFIRLKVRFLWFGFHCHMLFLLMYC